jgi:ABC-2 type transport system ATP-binding protein
MAIEVSLLVLDEPTLGLDIIYRKEFYDRLLNDFYDGNRTIIISTHQVEEIETLLSHLVFIDSGRIVLDAPMADLADTYTEVMVSAEHRAGLGRRGDGRAGRPFCSTVYGCRYLPI